VRHDAEPSGPTTFDSASAVAVPWTSSPGPQIANFTSPRLARRTMCSSTGAELAVAVAGALAGAALAVALPSDSLERVLSVAMLALVGFALVRPGGDAPATSRWRWPGLFAVAAWGGFAQAGIGLLLVPLLVRTAGLDVVRANARKVALVAAVSVPSLATFVAAGQVDWAVGAALAVGAWVGGVAGARLTTWLGPVWVWRLLLVMTAVTAVRACR
jgi:uncharacterized membrane protein YfcA